MRIFVFGETTLVHGTGKKGSLSAIGYCGKALVVVNRPVEAPTDCWLYDPARLSATGALALIQSGAAPVVISTRSPGLARPWSQ